MGDGFAFFDIIIFAMLAGYLVFQLRRVLGRRTGHEQRRSNPFSRQPDDAADNDNVVALPDHGVNESPADEEANLDPTVSGLTQLKMLDPSFDDREFLRGSKAAFDWIVSAFARGDTDELRNLLSPALLQSFEAAIEQRDAAGETLDTTVASIKSALIDDVVLNGAVAAVTVEFVSDQVKVVRNAEGAVVDGDPDKIETLTDIWTFSRDIQSNDPNWQLVATRDPEEAS